MSAVRHDKIGRQGGSGLHPRIALAIEEKIICDYFFMAIACFALAAMPSGVR